MPEGPSIVILKEEVQQFTGQEIVSVAGNSKIDQSRDGRKKGACVQKLQHFLICLKGFTLRVHFLLFGSYRVNEAKDAPARLSLKLAKGELNLYSCSLKFIEGDIDAHYDWTADVMNDAWDR